MQWLQYALLAALTCVAFLYYFRLDKLDKRVHVRRIVRIHRTLGLGVLCGGGLMCPPATQSVASLVVALFVLLVSVWYLALTRNDWKDGKVPEYATTSPGVLDHFFNG